MSGIASILFVGLGCLAVIGFVVVMRRRKRAARRFNRSGNEPNRRWVTGASGFGGDRNEVDEMAVFKDNLDQLKSLVEASTGSGHEPQHHVVEMLSAVYDKLAELDRRVAAFERQAEEYMKLPKGWQNP